MEKYKLLKKLGKGAIGDVKLAAIQPPPSNDDGQDASSSSPMALQNRSIKIYYKSYKITYIL